MSEKEELLCSIKKLQGQLRTLSLNSKLNEEKNGSIFAEVEETKAKMVDLNRRYEKS